MAPKQARPPTPHEQRLLTIREKRHEAQAQLLALRAEHKKDWVVQRLDVVVGKGLSDTVYFVWEGREIVCGELGDIMVVQRVVKHFVAQESRKRRRLLKRSARLSLTDLVEIAHMRGLEARDPGAEAAPAPGAGEAAPPAQAEAAAEQAAEQSEQEGEPQISEHESDEPDASAAPPSPARAARPMHPPHHLVLEPACTESRSCSTFACPGDKAPLNGEPCVSETKIANGSCMSALLVRSCDHVWIRRVCAIHEPMCLFSTLGVLRQRCNIFLEISNEKLARS